MSFFVGNLRGSTEAIGLVCQKVYLVSSYLRVSTTEFDMW